MQKVVRGGQVAVLVSPGYGSGWSTWNNNEALLYDPDMVAWVEADKPGDPPDIEAKYGDMLFMAGAYDLVIHWVPIGARFRIEEYDGYETLRLENQYQWYTA